MQPTPIRSPGPRSNTGVFVSEGIVASTTVASGCAARATAAAPKMPRTAASAYSALLRESRPTGSFRPSAAAISRTALLPMPNSTIRLARLRKETSRVSAPKPGGPSSKREQLYPNRPPGQSPRGRSNPCQTSREEFATGCPASQLARSADTRRPRHGLRWTRLGRSTAVLRADRDKRRLLEAVNRSERSGRRIRGVMQPGRRFRRGGADAAAQRMRRPAASKGSAPARSASARKIARGSR